MTESATPDATSAEVPQDRGFTLVELLVAMGLFGVLASVLLSVTFSSADVTDEVGRAADLTGESRLAIERMSRELRQASSIDAAVITATSIAITFWTDFNGNSIRDTAAGDPEVLTYRWTKASERLTLTADDAAGTAVTQPVLAGKVVDLNVQLLSSLWQYDGADGTTKDGATGWRELDAAGAPVGNNNGVPDGPELEHVDLIAVRITVADSGTNREFLMQADLRNQEVS